MINIQEVIIHLQRKLTDYRYQQKRTSKAKNLIKTAQSILIQMKNQLIRQLNTVLSNCQSACLGDIVKMNEYYANLLQNQRQKYKKQICQLQNEIDRQYKVMMNMRKQVEDLEQLMIMQQNREGEVSNESSHHMQVQSENQSQSTHPPQMINGLSIIEQEETDRTILSSGRSLQKARGQDNFIRIQEKDLEQEEQSQRSKKLSQFKTNSQLSGRLATQSQLGKNQCFSDQIESVSQENSAIYKFQPMQISAFSKRQHVHTDQNSEDASGQYQSMPISMEGFFGKKHIHQQFNAWEGRLSASGELRDVTNEQTSSEQERQSRSKMFLQQFRKTFDKCLSSSNVSRKTSKQDKNSTRSDRSDKRNMKQTKDITPSQNQKLISEMLREMDNNYKFSVGSRRNELKYQGQKRQGIRNGHGILYYQNGLCYEGEFRNNVRHGYGILKFNQIQIYRGQWQADELSGQGKIRNFVVINKRKNRKTQSPLLFWVSYCGYFRNNRFQGQGTLYLQGGQKFLGRFICGAACGEGTLYRKNGEVQTGVWRNNQLVQQF